MRGIKFNTHRKRSITAGRHQLMLGERTYIMGILNITPDSFSDGGDFINADTAIEHAINMVNEGADIIDIGGESTRPGSIEVSADEELRRIIPIIKALSGKLEVPLSVDTYKADVAKAAVEAGASIINDIWGLQKDINMAAAIAELKVPVVIMHNQIGTEYKTDIMKEICRFLQESINIGIKAGISHESIIIDPGIGFGKTPEQNIEVMARLGELNDLGYPVLLGTSRKSMLGKILNAVPKDRLEGTLATTVMGIIQGVDIVRVHDIKENYRTIRVTDAIVR